MLAYLIYVNLISILFSLKTICAPEIVQYIISQVFGTYMPWECHSLWTQNCHKVVLCNVQNSIELPKLCASGMRAPLLN